jgi:hypothetical protein
MISLPPIILLKRLIQVGSVDMYFMISMGLTYLLLLLILLLYLIVILFNLRGSNPAIFTSHTVTLSDIGITEITPVSRSEQTWNSVHEIQHNRDFIFLYIQRNAAHVIPRSAFSSKENAEMFLQKAIKHWKLANGKL